MFVRATLEIGEQKGYLIPQRAASRDSEGNLTARFVSKDGKVETRTFNKATASGNSWLVQSQIADGDQLIIDGLQSISDGMTVKTKDVTLDKTGVAHDVEAQGDGAAAKPTK
jgi:membrane fusion protein, multidrug efflux system